MAESTLKIYDGEKQIVDAVYCRNKETGELGWYDYVSEKFHPTPPPKINEAGLQWIDTGVQYIDTGYVPASLRPKGEWTECDWVEYDGHSECIHYPKAALRCSNCCNAFKKKLLWKRNYCPNCGADMRGNPNDS